MKNFCPVLKVFRMRYSAIFPYTESISPGPSGKSANTSKWCYVTPEQICACLKVNLCDPPAILPQPHRDVMWPLSKFSLASRVSLRPLSKFAEHPQGITLAYGAVAHSNSLILKSFWAKWTRVPREWRGKKSCYLNHGMNSFLWDAFYCHPSLRIGFNFSHNGRPVCPLGLFHHCKTYWHPQEGRPGSVPMPRFHCTW